jgi:hypothetical protein
MRAKRSTLVGLCGLIVLGNGLLAWATVAASAQTRVTLEPVHESGQSVTGAFEGWFKNPDGTFSLLLGYFNRNASEELDIPIGPDNRIEPGGPDQGQPTHFLPRRQWGIFTVTVPKDFGSNKITWTITANHQTNVIPASLDPLWEISPLKEESMGNTPPFLAFKENGPFAQGPRPSIMSQTVTMPNPIALTVWAADDAKVLEGAQKTPPGPPLTVTWSKFRGPGTVTFDNEKPALEKDQFKPPSATKVSGRFTTRATFSERGEYALRVVVNDWSGDGGRGFQCCWTNGIVSVSVKPARN